MELSGEELNLLTVWYRAVIDLNPEYLEPKDAELYEKIRRLINNARLYGHPTRSTYD
jgi:hypothetical protein